MKTQNIFARAILLAFQAVAIHFCFGQTPLFIPPSISGSTINLNVQSGTTNFFGSTLTPTYGINGTFLSPTIIVNKGDLVSFNVINNLSVATTMHWHGLHVSAANDGGPHQSISSGATWSPSFEILNNAGTFWYHPHGEGKTDLHVSKGLAGMFIIHDAEEQALGLPTTYGVDDFPVIVQTKAFDLAQNIAIADHMDTVVFVNGTMDAILDAPAQVVRLRLLNGSSMRAFYFGFSNNRTFKQIATDGGLIAAPLDLTRIQLAPGERTEILLDLTNSNGQLFDLMSYASEMEDGIFGAPNVGIPSDEIHMYEDNFLNGADFKLMSIQVVDPTVSPAPVTIIPSTLVPYQPFESAEATVNRTLVFDTLRLLPSDTPTFTEGPFGINNTTFDMGVVNIQVPLNSTEIWTIKNKTLIAHPFHIHDIQFNIIEKSGVPPTASETGWKDLVLVMPGDSVKFITKFTDFADPHIPYMYHCHILHHEDDGMMGTFIVFDPFASLEEAKQQGQWKVFPNPAMDVWNITGQQNDELFTLELFNFLGEKVYTKSYKSNHLESKVSISTSDYKPGLYLLKIETEQGVECISLCKQ